MRAVDGQWAAGGRVGAIESSIRVVGHVSLSLSLTQELIEVGDRQGHRIRKANATDNSNKKSRHFRCVLALECFSSSFQKKKLFLSRSPLGGDWEPSQH